MIPFFMALRTRNQILKENDMVLKTPPISADAAARMAVEVTRQFAGDVAAKEAFHQMVLRQWCVEQAVAACDTVGAVSEKFDSKSAVVPIADEIFRFITAKE